jgi:glucosylceramidase
LYVPGDYPGMSLPAANAVTVLRDYVLPALAANQLTTQVLVYDHNWATPAYPSTVLADPTLASSTQIAGIAWHWYGGPTGAMTTLHNEHPDKKNYVTEASGLSTIADEVKADFEAITHSMRNWSSSYVKWGLALDENHGPHDGGCGTCTGLITVNESTGAVTPTIDYYTLGHFSKFVLPGAVRIWSSNAPGVIDAAFVNPDGGRVLVAYNDSAVSRTFQVASQGRSFIYTLPALAGATFTWTEPAGATRAIRPQDAKAPRLPVVHRSAEYRVSATAQPIMASSYTDISNIQTEQCSDTDGGFDAGYANDGSWAEYRNIDFGSGVQSVAVRMASAGSGGTLRFHLDSVTGPLIAQVTVPVTGGWQTWQTVSAPVSGATGEHYLYVVFARNAGSGGIGNLNWFQFK